MTRLDRQTDRQMEGRGRDSGVVSWCSRHRLTSLDYVPRVSSVQGHQEEAVGDNGRLNGSF